MKEHLKSMLSNSCDKQMAKILPSFVRMNDLKVEPLYIESLTKLNFYIYFNVSEKRDAFTVELAWNQLNGFPPLGKYPVPRNWPELSISRGDINVPEFRFRLTKLWAKPKYDPWWEFAPRIGESQSIKMSVVANQSLNNIDKCEELVKDAVKKIQEFGVPYMSEIRTERMS